MAVYMRIKGIVPPSTAARGGGGRGGSGRGMADPDVRTRTDAGQREAVVRSSDISRRSFARLAGTAAVAAPHCLGQRPSLTARK